LPYFRRFRCHAYAAVSDTLMASPHFAIILADSAAFAYDIFATDFADLLMVFIDAAAFAMPHFHAETIRFHFHDSFQPPITLTPADGFLRR